MTTDRASCPVRCCVCTICFQTGGPLAAAHMRRLRGNIHALLDRNPPAAALQRAAIAPHRRDGALEG